MEECKWNEQKHGGQPCPTHGGGKKLTNDDFDDSMKLKSGKTWTEHFDGNNILKYHEIDPNVSEDELKKEASKYLSEDQIKQLMKITGVDSPDKLYGDDMLDMMTQEDFEDMMAKTGWSNKETTTTKKWNLGSNKANLTDEEERKLDRLARKLSKMGFAVDVETDYEDYGANMKWTAPIYYTKEGQSVWAMDPKQWIDFMNGDLTEDEFAKEFAEEHKEDRMKSRFGEKDPAEIVPEHQTYNTQYKPKDFHRYVKDSIDKMGNDNGKNMSYLFNIATYLDQTIRDYEADIKNEKLDKTKTSNYYKKQFAEPMKRLANGLTLTNPEVKAAYGFIQEFLNKIK